TRYGPIVEVWFDGANGEGPNGRRQAYDWPRIFGLVRRLQPRAVMFSDAGPDVRWCGNEAGAAGDPNWSTVDPAAVPYPGASGDAVIAALQHGDPRGSVWRPAETDTSSPPRGFPPAARAARAGGAATRVPQATRTGPPWPRPRFRTPARRVTPSSLRCSTATPAARCGGPRRPTRRSAPAGSTTRPRTRA